MTVKSSYRSYETQVSVYSGYVAGKGEAAADSTSARPGFSEHQTGLALDIGDANAGTACDFNAASKTPRPHSGLRLMAAEFGFLVQVPARGRKLSPAISPNHGICAMSARQLPWT